MGGGAVDGERGTSADWWKASTLIASSVSRAWALSLTGPGVALVDQKLPGASAHPGSIATNADGTLRLCASYPTSSKRCVDSVGLQTADIGSAVARAAAAAMALSTARAQIQLSLRLDFVFRNWTGEVDRVSTS